MLVKICGVRRPEDAQMALDAGADMIGIILVPGRKRTVSVETAKQIAQTVHAHPGRLPASLGVKSSNYFAQNSELLASKTPLLVGVVMNQPTEEILELQAAIGLDMVQLHGNEPLDYCESIPVPVTKRFTPESAQFNEWSVPKHSAILIDGEVGGNGELVDWTKLSEIPNTGAVFILGGGITPENVADAVNVPGVFMVDVSSGVEAADGYKDPAKVRAFITTAKKTA